MESRGVMNSRNEYTERKNQGIFRALIFRLTKTLTAARPRPAMSLIQGYSSGEDEGPVSPTNDAFGFASLPAAKKPRVEPPKPTPVIPHSAPDVLSEVRRPFDSSEPPDSQNTCSRIP